MSSLWLALLVLAVAAAAIYIAVRLTRPGDDDLGSFYDMTQGERFSHRWGFTDTRFELDGDRNVRVTGSRYPLSGTTMPLFIPFAEEVLGVPFGPEYAATERQDKEITASRAGDKLLEAIGQRLRADQFSVEDQERLVHSHGQLSVDEIYHLLYKGPLPRCVDVVLYPESEDDVRAAVELAGQHDVCLIPYGGGSNVSGALVCPASEKRVIASVDMRRMNRILSLDEENLQACVETGIYGMDLERELDARGYTSGHDPDSVELSTLGGWISTHASGMKKNRYGNIEDIVLEATLITPTGDIETLHATPRNSVGIQPRGLLFGSEGNLGIITKAVIKVHPKPEARRYGFVVLPSFENGVRFLKELRQTGAIPASIRLVNNFELRFGQALKPAPSSWKRALDKVQKLVLFRIKGFDPLQMCGCTVVMEGTREEVRHQHKVIFRTAKRHGGLSGGSSNGKRGYMLTFAIAYIRDFFNQFHALGETFETSVPWDRIMEVTTAVREELYRQHREHGIEGRPYLSYRVTQTYHTGVCIYFTMGFSGRALERATEVFDQIEHQLRQTILDHGGSLSHHHGVGKLRQGFLPQVHSQTSMDVLRQAKRAMDPQNLFAVRNGIFDQMPDDGSSSPS
ncbi:FAD-binding oxidoreductase [Candidatus Latescibacterota bacterium]